MGISISTVKNKKVYNKSIFITLQKDPSVKLLVVEGDGDFPFYSKYVTPEKIIIADKTLDYKIGDTDYSDGNKTAKKYVQFLVDKHQKNVKKNTAINYGSCFGIVDKDFDGINTKKYPNLGNYLITTDGRDLETTLLHYDYDHIKQCFNSDFNTEGEFVDIIDKAVENAAKIGKLRKLREDNRKKLHGNLTKDIKIDFKRVEESGSSTGEDGYYSFIDNNLDLNLNLFIGSEYNSDQIKELLDSIVTFTDDSLSYCRGHDIFDFVTCFYKKKNRISPDFLINKVGINKILSIRGNYENLLKEYFNDSNFINKSPMYSFIRKI